MCIAGKKGIVLENPNIDLRQQELLEAYIQAPDKMPFYESAYQKMHQAGAFGFQWQWSWWGFFFGWAFMLYRKAYLPAIGTFILSFFITAIPFGVLLLMIATGGSSTYFVLKRFHDFEQELQGERQAQLNAMQLFGGVHTWVIALVVVLYAFIFIAGIIAALSMG